MNKKFSCDINDTVDEYFEQYHLLSTSYFPKKKLKALNVGTAMPLLYQGFLGSGHEIEEHKSELMWIAKFMAWIFIVDDCLEQKELHEATNQAVNDMFQSG